MTHLWKSEEWYTFDMPGNRVNDVYGKTAYAPIGPYIQHHCPKVSKVEFDSTAPAFHVMVRIPKYPESRPYFTDEDVKTLLETYMKYANATREEMQAWYTMERLKRK